MLKDRPTGGTAGGKWFRDAQGTAYFGKMDVRYHGVRHRELQTAAEVICSVIYRQLGYTTPETRIELIGVNRYAMSKELSHGSHLSTLHLVDTPEFRQLRVFAAFLKDWDRLMLGPNNFLDEKSAFALFDFGGALGARAGGAHKPGPVFSEAIGSFEAETNGQAILDAFRRDGLSPDHAWHKLTQADYRQAAKKLRQLSDDQIERAVEAAEYSRPSDAAQMIFSLKTRRDALIRYLEQL